MLCALQCGAPRMGCLVGGGLTLVETGQVPVQEAFQGVPGIYLLLLCDVFGASGMMSSR